MRVVAIAAAAVALVLSGGSSVTLEPGPATIRLTATLVGSRYTATGTARTYALFNRPAYPDRLGTAVSSCVTVSRGWLDCSYLLRLSRGVIVARGLVPAAAAFRLFAIVGGTGYYANTGGELTVQPLGGGQAVFANLLAF